MTGGPDGATTLDQPFQFRESAEVTSVSFHAGEPALAGGIWLYLNVKFSTHGVPAGPKWEIWPHEAQVRLSRDTHGSSILLGAFRAPLSQSIRPAFSPNKSEVGEVSFLRCFSPAEISAIEKWRDGRDFMVRVNVVGAGKRGTFLTWSYFNEYNGSIPRSVWHDMLVGARFEEHVHLAIPATGDARVKEGLNYLRAALDHHARGSYSDVAQTCRKAIEEIGKAGFGRKAPQDVKALFLHQDPKKYTLEERAAIILTAATLLVHSGSHAGEEERDWRRADAELALATTAALLQVAPSRLTNTEQAPPSPMASTKATE
jgi:hypothetical protein